MSTGKRRLAFTVSVLVVSLAAIWATGQPKVISTGASPFHQVWQVCLGESRIKPQGDAQLENTYWKLVELNGKAVAAAARRREPHLLLNSEGKSLQGSGGCNTMRGGYQLDGDRLKFTQIATTRMACPDSYMTQESEFLKVLEAANSFKLSAGKLELYGDGKLLARFEARDTK